ncbi:flotillin domain-containing protein [Sulfitobacter pacificus]|uniref:Flotillin family protein n=1 Tax=Sulfitobacter pacificus TaxID=1499314 RepID=A0ABQ5VI19_9RHOB|nr:flotillin domain-containing protein [Sulfitobacter pacificus]GLQ26681.1 flotillin family protein [Sulfitobacter pacificus]
MIWVFSIIVLAIVILLGIWFLQKFYAKATLNSALVRTGLGGRKVVLNGGCIALPILHQVQRVMMGAVTFSAERKGREGLLTEDQLRADVAMEFEFRVEGTDEAVATAAQALGSRVERGGDAIEELLNGSLLDAMQNAAATRSLDALHSNRASFTSEVEAAVAKKAAQFGLSLISASLIRVDQSDLSQLDEQNAFAAKGLRRHAELVSEQRRARVRIETETDIAVRESGLAKHQRQLEIDRTEREATIAQQETIERLEAESRAKKEAAKSEADLLIEQQRLTSLKRIEAEKVANDEALRRTEMAAILALEETKIANDTKLAQLRTAEFKTQAAEETARVAVLLAAEDVQAQKERAVARREHETAGLKLAKEIELSTAQAKSDAETLALKTKAEAEAAKTLAAAELAKSEAAAKGKTALIEAENTMSDALVGMRLEEKRLDRMPEIMTQMMKPVEKIDSIKINHIGGTGMQAGPSGEGSSDSAFGSAMDQILGMAVRLPAMKQMGEEIGLDFDPNIAGRTADYANRIKAKDDKK